MNQTSTLIYKQVSFNPFHGPEICQVVPMTESQTEIWLSCTLGGEEGNVAYNESNSLRLAGELDVPAMKKAMESLIERHQSLRCSFSGDGKHMVIYDSSANTIHYKDLSDLDDLSQKKAIESHLDSHARHIFDITNGPLFKSSILKISHTAHLFTFTAHHLIIDGWSISVVMEELGKLYSAYSGGDPHRLPSPKTYSEFAKEQEHFLGTAAYEHNERFWLAQYEKNIPVVNLPTTHTRPKIKTYASSRLDQVLDVTLVNSLRKTAVGAGCTFVHILLTAFEVYLNRLTGQEDIVVGLPSSGQASMGYYDLVGHCVNFLPIRSRVDDSLTFQQYLLKRKPEIYDAYEHQQLTFGALLKKLRISRDASRIPLVPVALNVDFGMEDDIHFHHLEYEMISNPKAFLNFEIFLNVNGSEKKVVLEWNYNKQLFDQNTMENMLQGFEKWLKFSVSNPQQKISSFELNDINKGQAAFRKETNFAPALSSFRAVHELIEDAAIQFEDKIAVFCNDNHYTYRELNEKANQLGHFLISKGLKKGEVVGIIMDRSVNTIVAILGTLKAGGAYLPVDTDYPPGRIEYILQDASRMHLTDSRYSGKFSTVSEEIVFDDAFPKSSPFSTTAPEIQVSSEDAAYIIYTSGSTGRPKGVILEHGNLYNFLKIVEENPKVSAEAKFLAVSSISFDIAILEVLLPYVHGAQCYILDQVQRKDPGMILEQVETHHITHMFATPSHWKMLLDSNRWTSKFPQFNVISGGEALSIELARQLLPLTKSLWNIYGPTETTVYSTIKEITNDVEPITIGKAVHGTQIYILDESLKAVKMGEIGELFIAGDGVGRGYLNRPELTSENFLKDPRDASGNGRMYRTGDLGKFTPDGEIIIQGRKDFQVKIRGHRIELGEIEQALLQLTHVRDAVVLTKEINSGHNSLVAYILSQHSGAEKNGKALQATPTQVKEWNSELQHFLPVYMLPMEYLMVDKFPLTTSGKVDRKSLEKIEITAHEPTAFIVSAETSEEKIIAEIWEKALGISPIDITHDFFELGGHSMIAVQVMSILEKKVNIKLPISVLFESPTIQSLARLIQSKDGKNPWKSLVAIKPTGSKIPLYIVHGGGMNVMPFYSIAKHLDADQPLYGLQAYGLNGKDEPHTTIESIASHYVKELTQQNPQGPYALAGYSLGGIVAFEMARQLKLQGKEIRSLLMFDTYAIKSDHRSNSVVRTYNFLRNEWGKRLFDLDMLISNPQLLKRLKKTSFRHKMRKVKRTLNIQEKEKEAEIIQIINKIKKIHVQAGDNYIIPPYDGEIYLFRAKIRTNYERDFKFFGWKPYVKKVNVIEMEGEHTTMFEPPHEKDFVRILQKILNEAN